MCWMSAILLLPVYMHCVPKKVSTFKLSVTLSSLNRFSKFLHCWNRKKFATKPIRHYPSHLRHLAALPWKIKNSNFPQIFSRYGSKCKQIAFWANRWTPVSRDISRRVISNDLFFFELRGQAADRVCGLSSWLKTKSLTVSTFSSVRALGGLPLPGRLSTVHASCNFSTAY